MKHDMARIILITGNFPIYDTYGFSTGKTEFVVSHGINEATGENVVLPPKHPKNLNGVFDPQIQEWVLY